MSRGSKTLNSKTRTPTLVKNNPKSKSQQFLRFKEMAKELGADESPQALDRAFARLDMKKKETLQPEKRKAKRKKPKAKAAKNKRAKNA